MNRRQAAFLIDLIFFWPMLLLLAAMLESVLTIGFRVPQAIIPSVAITWPIMLLFAFKDGFSGYSPGKYIMGVRVVDVDAHTPGGFWQSFRRNILFCLPVINVCATMSVALEPWYGRRRGDDWANTMIIWCKHARKAPFLPVGAICFSCRYDLTGNVSGICPECGTPIPEATRGRIAASPPAAL